jgi:hypothetical protein
MLAALAAALCAAAPAQALPCVASTQEARAALNRAIDAANLAIDGAKGPDEANPIRRVKRTLEQQADVLTRLCKIGPAQPAHTTTRRQAARPRSVRPPN